MTTPFGEHTSHTDTIHGAASFPAVNDTELDRILHQRNEGDTRLIATIVRWYLRTPEGRDVILAVLGTDDNRIREIAREVYAASPVKSHSHRARSVTVSTWVRGLSRIGALIGAVVGGLAAWWLWVNYAITTITFGTPNDMHSVSVIWVKTGIAVVSVLFFAMLGALVGPRKRQQQTIDFDVALDLEMTPTSTVGTGTHGGTR